jgi:hypothetical protein
LKANGPPAAGLVDVDWAGDDRAEGAKTPLTLLPSRAEWPEPSGGEKRSGSWLGEYQPPPEGAPYGLAASG